MSKKITIEIDEETAKWYAQMDGYQVDSACGEVSLASQRALAKRQTDTRAERLKLPWRLGHYHKAPGVAQENGGMVTWARDMNEEQAQLMAAAPELAAALEALAKVSGLHQEEPEQVNAIRILQKAGWISNG